MKIKPDVLVDIDNCLIIVATLYGTDTFDGGDIKYEKYFIFDMNSHYETKEELEEWVLESEEIQNLKARECFYIEDIEIKLISPYLVAHNKNH